MGYDQSAVAKRRYEMTCYVNGMFSLTWLTSIHRSASYTSSVMISEASSSKMYVMRVLKCIKTGTNHA